MMVSKSNISLTILCGVVRCNFSIQLGVQKGYLWGLKNNSVIFLGLKILGLSFFLVD